MAFKTYNFIIRVDDDAGVERVLSGQVDRGGEYYRAYLDVEGKFGNLNQAKVH